MSFIMIRRSFLKVSTVMEPKEFSKPLNNMLRNHTSGLTERGTTARDEEPGCGPRFWKASAKPLPIASFNAGPPNLKPSSLL